MYSQGENEELGDIVSFFMEHLIYMRRKCECQQAINQISLSLVVLWSECLCPPIAHVEIIILM